MTTQAQSLTVKMYRVFCTNEQLFVTVWNTDQPTVCPNNNTHSINSTLTTILSTVSPNSVLVENYNYTTGGLYCAESRTMTATANTTTSYTLSWPFDISVISVFFTPASVNTGDIVNCYVGPNTTIGTTTVDLSLNGVVINVSNSVIVNVKRGMLINLVNTTTNSSTILGRVISVDTTGLTLTCETPTSILVPSGSLVQVTVNNIRNFSIGQPGTVSLSSRNSMASFLPANTLVRVSYTNASVMTTKTFSFGFEYLY